MRPIIGAFIKKIEELLGGGPGGSKRIRTFRWLVLIGLVGCGLMILNTFPFLSVKNVDPILPGRASPPPGEAQETFLGGGGKDGTSFRDYEHAYESQLKDILTKIVGVGEVEVLVTIDSTEEITVEKNTRDSQQVTNETDPGGAKRHITNITRSGDPVVMQQDGKDAPLVTKTIKPKVRGVVIVAKGAENLTVKKLIVEAVERGLDVPPHRISVVPRKQ